MSQLDDFYNEKPEDYVHAVWVRERSGEEYVLLNRITHYVSNGGRWTSASSSSEQIRIDRPKKGRVSSWGYEIKEAK